jgi:hypothetical protein
LEEAFLNWLKTLKVYEIMIEVFKTDVNTLRHADILVEHIQRMFNGYQANFDLEDCDRILRVKNERGHVNSIGLIRILSLFGFHAEVLEDDDPSAAICLHFILTTIPS